MAGARNCLWVAVTEDSLQVGVHFPFSLMFLPEIYGLEFAVPGNRIRSAERVPGMLRNDWVRVTVERTSGKEEAFDISTGDADGFLRAVGAIRREVLAEQ